MLIVKQNSNDVQMHICVVASYILDIIVS